MILAANYLDIPSMLEVTCKAVASLIRGKTPDEIRAVFNIENDFTPEEVEEVLACLRVCVVNTSAVFILFRVGSIVSISLTFAAAV
jgi:hypothetical protein